MIQKVSWQEYRLSCWPFFRGVWLQKIQSSFFYYYVIIMLTIVPCILQPCVGGLKELNNLIACTKVIQVAIPSTVSS